MIATDPRCGSTAGYQRHRRNGEPTCPACRAAAAADRRQRAAYTYLTRGQKMLIDSTGTRRRIQALAALGWPLTELARRLGVSFQNVNALTVRDQVRRTSAAKVAALYDELSMTPGPSTRAVARAANKRWSPPLAWDDDTIDDPLARPAPKVESLFLGHRDLEREEQVVRWTALGLSAGEIAMRLRLTKRTVVRIRSRHRDEDVAS